MIPTLLIALFLSYFVGAIPFGLLFSRMVGKDVRQEGSGNIGATNVNRVLGKKLGILTLLCDILKGFLPVFVTTFFLVPSADSAWIIALCGLAAVMGHMFSVYLGFSGGKGVATALGVFLFFSPQAILLALLLFIVVVYFSGFVSAGSLAAAAVIPLLLFMLGSGVEIIFVALIIAILIWVKHSANIKRLIAGEEKSWKSKG
ncbi:MAG: acyl-phosphate glycerol 3-phosphate acyltransferase [Desulfocapsa sp.]|nr:MAG: acyl-phosphate glycerol 3-phosphate acyltransferase [Desulfocapsa sp.]